MSRACPFSGELVGDRCTRGCWMRNNKALGGCAAIDSGTTELTEHDVARLRRRTVADVKDSIQRGRKKLALWIRLVETLEDCPDAITSDTSEAKKVLEALPFREVSDRATEYRVAALLADHGVLVAEAMKKLRRVV